MNNEEVKKRTLDAINRRFKQGEAELRPHLQNDKALNLKPQHQQDNNSTSKIASTTPPIKDNLRSSGNVATQQDPELKAPAYFELLHPVNQNLLTEDKVTHPKSIVDDVMLHYLQHGDAARKYSKGLRKLKKNDEHILLDNFVRKGDVSREEAQLGVLKRQAKRSKKHASLKKHKMLGSFYLPTEYHNFERFMPLHEMWKCYISQLLKHIEKDQLGKLLLNADLHGAIILVAHCKDTSLSGVNGIIIRETAETFGIIMQDNKFQVVLKKLSVFMLQAGSWKVTLYGDKLIARSVVP